MYPTKKTFYTYSQLKTVLLVLFCFQHFINQNMSYISQSSKSGQGGATDCESSGMLQRHLFGTFHR